ncbi:MAG: putative cysteine rich repeat domain protein [Anaeromyxobacteraceae bacterium]|nr:putative cysteine rich repeat domain protein [Anaeromyxobacteraceae bacterium]
MVRATAAAVILFTASISPARAVDPCTDDVVRLCPGTALGKGAVRRCLKANQDALGEACRAKLEADDASARRFVREFLQACKADLDQYCAAVEPGGGRMLACLSRHQLEVSRPCQSELDRVGEARDRLAAFRGACTKDLAALCADVPQQAGPLLECVEANAARVSPECKATDFPMVSQAAAVVENVEDMASRERVREALEILQGLDSVAFSRSQVLLQVDSFQSLAGKGNAGRMLFNPQFVFGKSGEFALQFKVPVTALYPYAADAPTQFGLGAVSTAFAWNFMGGRGVRQYLALGLQIETASTAAIGGPWALVPSYAIGVALARWFSITTQVQWMRSLGSSETYPELNLLVLEPILVASLPGRSFVGLDTRLGWNFTTGTFIPLMKGMAGFFVDRQKSLSISAWYQATLTEAAASQFYKYEIGMGLAYFFDW